MEGSQGLYPWGAPVGYINNGKGKIKTLCPIQSELVIQLFNLYISGEYNVKTLSKEMERRGLKNKRGNWVCKNGISRILRNPFYIGIMKSKDKLFEGNHKAIICKRIFKQVQLRLERRTKTRGGVIHDYLFRKLIRCAHCNYVMSGSLQKGMVYYRCKTKTCKTKCYREDFVEEHIKRVLKTITLNKKEVSILNEILEYEKNNYKEIQDKLLAQLNLDIIKIESKKEKILDAYIDNIIEKEEYEKRKEKYIFGLVGLKEQKNTIKNSKDVIFKKIEDLVELCKSPLKLYLSGLKEEKRELLEIISSNLSIDRRKAIFTMVSPFFELANRDILSLCALNRDTVQTLNRKIIYTDKNTSPIIPKPLKKKQLKQFFVSAQKTVGLINFMAIKKYH